MSATWLCTFTVLVDLPSDMAIADMEGFVAKSIADNAFHHGFPGNVSAQLVATAGNSSVIDPDSSGKVVVRNATTVHHDPYAIGDPNPMNGAT